MQPVNATLDRRARAKVFMIATRKRRGHSPRSRVAATAMPAPLWEYFRGDSEVYESAKIHGVAECVGPPSENATVSRFEMSCPAQQVAKWGQFSSLRLRWLGSAGRARRVHRARARWRSG